MLGQKRTIVSKSRCLHV